MNRETASLSAGQIGFVSSGIAVLARGVMAIACACLIGMTLVEAWQVYARYVLNNSPSWTEPVALLLMSVAMMFGASVGVRNEAHFGFPLVVHLAPPPLRVALVTLARLIIIVIGLFLAYWGGALFLDGWGVRMAGAPLPQGLFFLPICLGGVLIALFALERLITPRVEH